jgi:hypothetical protein
LGDHLGASRKNRTRQSSEALLGGKLFDDRGNRMSPTWARKGSKRWRYYVSQAALQGDKSKEGSIPRVPAADVETLVAQALGKLSPDHAASQTGIRDLIDRVVIGHATIRIHLSEVADGSDGARILTQDCAFNPDDPVAGFPRAGDRQGGSRRTPGSSVEVRT